MYRTRDLEQTLDQWRRDIAAGGEVVIHQNPLSWVGYLVLMIGMTAICVFAALHPPEGTLSDWLVFLAGVAGIAFFGLLGIPLIVWRMIRGRHPIVRINQATVSVGDQTLALREVSWVRGHNGTYGDVAPEKSGGVSVFVGREDHAMEIPLPRSIPVGAVVAILQSAVGPSPYSR